MVGRDTSSPAGLLLNFTKVEVHVNQAVLSRVKHFILRCHTNSNREAGRSFTLLMRFNEMNLRCKVPRSTQSASFVIVIIPPVASSGWKVMYSSISGIPLTQN